MKKTVLCLLLLFPGIAAAECGGQQQPPCGVSVNRAPLERKPTETLTTTANVQAVASGGSLSALATLAGGMSAGSWATLTTNNISVLAQGASDGNILPFGFKGVWDATARQAYYLGADHGCTPNFNVHQFRYDDATNTWSEQALTNFQSCHGYDHLSMDNVTRTLYFWGYDSSFGTSLTMSKYSTATTGPWTTQAAPNFQTGTNVAHGSDWFAGPISGEGVNGAWAGYNCGSNGGEVVLLRPSNGTFAADVTGFGGTGTYHCFLSYSKVFNVAVFGGGNANSNMVRRLNADKTVTNMPNSPIGLGVQQAIMAADPVSGVFIVRGNNNLYSYNPSGTGTWTQLANPPANTVGNPALPEDVIAIPVPTYGVLMFVTCRATTCRVDVYKHTAASSQNLDFLQRCSVEGIQICNGFDTAADIAGQYGNEQGTIADGSLNGAIDTTQAASGAGSLVFDIPQSAGTGAGQFFRNFPPITDNQDVYIQWRQRFPPERITSTFGGDGWKQAIISWGDEPGCTPGQSATCAHSSCQTVEVTPQNFFYRQFFQLYQGCPGSSSLSHTNSYIHQIPFSTPWNPNNFKLQNNIAYPPGCLYDTSGQPGGPGYFPPQGGCVGYFANEWMHFQMHIHLGNHVTNEYQNSQVEVWVGRQGQPATKIIDWSLAISNGGSPKQNIGKIWLLPYDSQRPSGAGGGPSTKTWYDQLVISKVRIPDPKF